MGQLSLRWAFVFSLCLHLLILLGNTQQDGFRRAVTPQSLHSLQLQLPPLEKLTSPHLAVPHARTHHSRKTITQRPPKPIAEPLNQTTYLNQVPIVEQGFVAGNRPTDTENGVSPEIHQAILAYRLQLAITLQQLGKPLLMQAKAQNIERWEIVVLHIPSQTPQFSLQGLVDPASTSEVMQIMQTIALPSHLLPIPFSFSLQIL